ncbi:hypothetical protein JJQ58_01020 [Mammaliicoccus fleurettii]|uniref:Uncharacterized protein n=1 Tax=Mammaliicoccus fleurettii TaxID=150056 RepID=A0ABS5MJI2_9STAP|nr:hypothetical protein [Mammaliicoccus fleurettii]MBL0846560.1 hypothetical protein [Mammaliicoccus fleurettii]MBS3671001.1 hypothetical protein [Mammaliicoccus fleurettii]MBS3696060.1 hypothetical protein [Mammaliicoccus fleurettii]MEB7779232.1 hypothetical protein [Mammaliicoccus fleurettii]
MNTMKFSENQLHEIRNKLMSENRPLCCDNQQVAINPDVFKLDVVSDTLPGPYAELVMTECQNCGEAKIYSAKSLNITPNN